MSRTVSLKFHAIKNQIASFNAQKLKDKLIILIRTESNIKRDRK